MKEDSWDGAMMLLRHTKVMHGLLRRKGSQYAQQTKRKLWKESFDHGFQIVNLIRNDAYD